MVGLRDLGKRSYLGPEASAIIIFWRLFSGRLPLNFRPCPNYSKSAIKGSIRVEWNAFVTFSFFTRIPEKDVELSTTASKAVVAPAIVKLLGPL